MDVSIEWIFFFVFFAPMGIMVAMNLVLHRALPEPAASWVPLAAPSGDTQPGPRRQAPVASSAREASISNDEAALEAA
jgi:hypothetical protein